MAAPDAPASASPWTDVEIDACTRVPVLAPGQPARGLLWVLSGTVEFEAGTRRGRVRKGDVVAFRLGEGLRWSAPHAVRARWSAREVDLSAAGARAWTPGYARDLPDVGASALPAAARRRAVLAVAGWLATAAVAAAVRSLLA